MNIQPLPLNFINVSKHVHINTGQLYISARAVCFVEEFVSRDLNDKLSISNNLNDKLSISNYLNDKLSISNNLNDKLSISYNLNDKLSISLM